MSGDADPIRPRRAVALLLVFYVVAVVANIVFESVTGSWPESLHIVVESVGDLAGWLAVCYLLRGWYRRQS